MGRAAALALALALGAGIVSGQDDRVMDMGLDDLIRLTIRYNPDIEVARREWRINHLGVAAAYGVFEPSLVVNAERSRTEREHTPMEQAVRGTTEYEEHVDSYKFGLEGQLVGGATYQVGYSFKNAGNNLVGTYLGLGELSGAINAKANEDPLTHLDRTLPLGSLVHEYDLFAGASIRQPLLRGGGLAGSLSDIKAARANVHAAFQEYRKQLMLILTRVESAYWGLVLAQEEFRMASESVEIAKKLVEDGNEWAKAGKIAEIETVRAAAGLALRTAQLSEARQAHLDAMMRVKLLASDSRLAGDRWIRAIEPLVPPDADRFALKAGDMLVAARLVQPDYLSRRADLEKENVRVAFLRNQVWPQLDLLGSVGYAGRGEDTEEAMENLKSRGYPAWSVGVELRLPLGARVKERHELRMAVERRAQAEARVRAIEHEMGTTLESLCRQADMFKNRIRDARVVSDYSKKVLDVELSWLEAGKSTMRRVYEAEEDLFKARRGELETIAKYREFLMQLAFVSGQTLKRRGIETESDGRLILSKQVDPEGLSRRMERVSDLPKVEMILRSEGK